MSNDNPEKSNLYEKIVHQFFQQNGFELCSETVLALDRALQQCSLAKKLLYDIADELDKWHFNSSVSKVVGSSAGIAGLLAGMFGGGCYK